MKKMKMKMKCTELRISMTKTRLTSRISVSKCNRETFRVVDHLVLECKSRREIVEKIFKQQKTSQLKWTSYLIVPIIIFCQKKTHSQNMKFSRNLLEPNNQENKRHLDHNRSMMTRMTTTLTISSKSNSKMTTVKKSTIGHADRIEETIREMMELEEVRIILKLKRI